MAAYKVGDRVRVITESARSGDRWFYEGTIAAVHKGKGTVDVDHNDQISGNEQDVDVSRISHLNY